MNWLLWTGLVPRVDVLWVVRHQSLRISDQFFLRLKLGHIPHIRLSVHMSIMDRGFMTNQSLLLLYSGNPSITDGVHRNENFVEIIPVFSTFSNFFKKKKIHMKAILCNFSIWLLKYFLKNIEKLPSKAAHNPTRPPVFSPASFFFVKLRQF